MPLFIRAALARVARVRSRDQGTEVLAVILDGFPQRKNRGIFASKTWDCNTCKQSISIDLTIYNCNPSLRRQQEEKGFQYHPRSKQKSARGVHMGCPKFCLIWDQILADLITFSWFCFLPCLIPAMVRGTRYRYLQRFTCMCCIYIDICTFHLWKKKNNGMKVRIIMFHLYLKKKC